MIEKYIDVLFKAIEMKDMELIVFVLSRDTSVEKFRKLKIIKNYPEGNVYEHLLFNKENDILRLFIDTGLLQIINEPINDREELIIDLAYRYKNLPLILSLLSEKEVDLNIKMNGLSFIEKVTTTYSFENTILEHLRISRPDLPIDDYKNKKTDCELLSKIVVDDSAFPDENDNQENFVDKIIPKDKQDVIKKGLFNISQTIKSKFSEIHSSPNKKEEILNEESLIITHQDDTNATKKEPVEGELTRVDSNSDERIDEIEEIIIINTEKKKKK